ncbi:MAG: ABC transporter ATP-binding protein [Chloroflexi bacterium]|nr:ABC transporter ATP-binding protein [Chloroflexota bacterium]
MSVQANADGAVSSAPKARIANVRWLLGYIGRHKGSAVGSIVTGIIGGIATSAEPLMIGIIVDHLQQGLSIDQMLGDLAILVVVSLIAILAFFGMRYYSGDIAYSVNYDIRKDLYDSLLTQENAFFQRNAIGDLIARVHADTEMIFRLLAIGFNRFGGALFNLITVFILLAMIHLPLTFVVFIVLAVSTTFQIRVGAALNPMFEKVQDQGGVISSIVQDAASGIHTIKTFGREDSFIGLFGKENREYRRRWLFFKRRYEPVGMLPNMISTMATAVVVLFGGILAIQGEMSLGNFTQFLFYLAWISQSLLHLGTIYQRYQQSLGALARLTLLLREPEIASRPDAVHLPDVHGDIRFENVGVEIDGQWLLRNVSLDIPAGTVVGIVGPTGSGKTLLVSLLARALDTSEGRVRVDGVDVRHLDLADLRRGIAYVPQSTYLFSASLRDNIRMGREEASEDELLRAAQISRVSNDIPQLPRGMDTLVGEKGVMLSGGQKQRVAIARAVVRDPAILVLDDALSSVDTHTAADILHGLRDVLIERTSLIIAHRIATVKDADLIVVIDNGQILESGTHQSLIAQHGMYARMAARELEESEIELIRR